MSGFARLPNANRAAVAEAKVRDYLLSDEHPAGRAKAGFFRSFGFRPVTYHQLVVALKQHARTAELVQTEDTPFGRRYVVEGLLVTPDGRGANVRSVWFVDQDGGPPRLVTAYPCRKEAPK